MRIAFYAPLKSPTHGTPSGDRRVAGLLMDALAHAGHRVQVASTFRSYDGDGDEPRQRALRTQGEMLAQQLADDWKAGPADERPDLWFTYHLYYKAPDWLGPTVSRTLGIPYVISEASYAQKRAQGPWALGHEGSADAIRQAALVLAPTRDDMPGLEQIIDARRIVHLPPFLDTAPYVAAIANRRALREELAKERD
ncbi:MAG: glycosyltransferase family 1 protein, partial [Betaproteobacteria bacterium]|nr:glycosyltransferase family 1 protein [Betaproteobacteria bacterium]